MRHIPLLLLALASSTGCAAAVGAAVAAQEIQRGFSGVQQLVASSRTLLGAEAELPASIETPFAGTYRGWQALGSDTAVFYVRTVTRPTAPILNDDGEATGYALAAISAASLDSLEARVGRLGTAEPAGGGSAVFFVEGTQPAAAGSRSLYAAAFLGQLPSGESPRADSVTTALRELGIDLQAPPPDALSGRALSHDVFDDAADGVFTLTGSGEAVYEQEVDIAGEGQLELRFERISATTLPEPDWLDAGRIAPAGN